MVILSTDTGIKKINVTPRNNDIDSCTIMDESQSTINQVTIDSVVIKEYYTEVALDFQTALIEGRFYMITLLDSNGALLLREKAFCTDQPIESFSVNDGQYITLNGNTEFIVYE